MNRLAHLGSITTALICLVTVSAALAQQPLIRNRTPLEKPDSHGGFLAFAFAPDGKTIAGGTGAITVSIGNRKLQQGGDVLLWNAATGKLLKTLGQHGDSVRHVAFSRDGRTLLSASRGNGLVKVWQMPAGRLRHTLKIDAEDKSANLRWPHLAVSDNGRTLATINSRSIPLGENSRITTGGELAVWDLESGEKIFSKPESDAHAAALTPDGRGLVTVHRKVSDLRTDERGRTRFRTTHTLDSWNLASGEVLNSAELGRTSTPEKIALLDGNTVVVLSGVGLALRDRNSGEASHEIKWHKDRSFGDAYLSADGKAVGRANPGWMEVVDVETGQSMGSMTTEFPNHLWNVAFSSDLTRAAGQDNSAGRGPALLDLVHQTVTSTKKDHLAAGQKASPAKKDPRDLGLRVTYFDDMHFENAVVTDVVKEPLHFEWKAAPVPELPEDHWSCRYEGFLLIEEPGEYELHLKTDDGSRLYLDGRQVIDNWGNHAIRQRSAKINLTAGRHPLRIDYYEHIKDAHMRFLYTKPKTGRTAPVPLHMLRHDPSSPAASARAAE